METATIGENGTLDWQGNGSSSVDAIDPPYRSLLNPNQLLVGNAPGDLVEFASPDFPGSIHPLRIQDGENIIVGTLEITAIHTPGHTPGSQCFKVNNNLISGDTLFIQGCGRVDLPGSDSEQMYNSLKHLSSLPDETVLYPGHHYSEEECSTLGEVKEKNVHMRIADLDTWKQLMG